MKDGRSDSELVNAAQAGNLQAFDELVQRYQLKFLNFAFRMLGNHEDAQDILQKSFINIYKGLPNFKQKSRFSTWAYRIVMNTCTNYKKSLQERMKKFFIPLDKTRYNQDGDIIPFQVADKKNSTKQMVTNNEKSRLIQEAIESLPLDKKTVIILRVHEDLSYDEIAQITGIKRGTVKTRIFRAKELLQKKLEGIV